MKKIFFSFFCSLIVSFCLAQKDKLLVVASDKQNIIYLGIDNPISVVVSGISTKDIAVKVSSGKISGANGRYTVNIKDTNIKEVTVSAFLKEKKNKKIGEIKFRVHNLPTPVIELCGHYYNGNVTIDELKSASAVVAQVPENLICLMVPIISFDIALISDSTYVSISNENNSFISDKQKKLLGKAKNGDIIFIKNVAMKMVYGNVIYASPLILNVAEKK